MRIKLRDLEQLVGIINKTTGSPTEYATRVDGKFKSNVGHYCLDGAYGGWKLVRVANEWGGNCRNNLRLCI